MLFNIRLPILFCLASGFALAESWPGFLVNLSCFESLERNHNPQDTLMFVNRDRGAEVRYCAPGAKTESFGIVQEDGRTLRFDSAGNMKAANLVRQTGERPLWPVNVSGQLQRGRVKVDSIIPAASAGKR
jgi:hypothetical protein